MYYNKTIKIGERLLVRISINGYPFYFEPNTDLLFEDADGLNEVDVKLMTAQERTQLTNAILDMRIEE